MTERTDKKRSFWIGLALALAAFYVLAAMLEGYRLYPDSYSYISMELSREPMYSIFLATLRRLLGWGGEDFWLQAAAVVQSLLTAWAGWYFTRRLTELFRLRERESLLLALCTLLPSLFCRFFANRRAMYSYSMISESLAFPLFLAFLTCVAAYALRGGKRDFVGSAVLAFVLISVRKQMYVTLPLLLLGSIWRGLRHGGLLRRLAAALLAAVLVLAANSLLDRGYNYVLRGEALRHTGDMRFVATMLLYTAEPEDAAAIDDAELRGIFEQVLRLADERQLTCRYAPSGWFDRSLFFMNHYDLIQFGCLGDTIAPLARAKYPGDETAMQLERDRIYDGLNAALLPVGWTRVLRTAADSFGMGLVNTAAAMKRPLIPAAVLLYAAWFALFTVNIRRRREDEAVVAGLVLASILGNVALVSLTIFCQPRYTLYNMPVFYASLLLLLLGAVRRSPAE